METIWTILRDARFGLRLLARDKAFALVAILTLALGIGANTAAFSWMQNVIVRSVPGVADPSELVVITPQHASGSITDTMSYLDLKHLSARKEIFNGIAGSQFTPASLEIGE